MVEDQNDGEISKEPTEHLETILNSFVGYFVSLDGVYGIPESEVLKTSWKKLKEQESIKKENFEEEIEESVEIDMENLPITLRPDNVRRRQKEVKYKKYKIYLSEKDFLWLQKEQKKEDFSWKHISKELFKYKKSFLRTDVDIDKSFLAAFNSRENSDADFDVFKAFVKKEKESKTIKWTKEENEILKLGISIFDDDFSEIAEFLEEVKKKQPEQFKFTTPKNRDQCQKRSTKIFGTKGKKWTEEEISKLKKLFEIYKNEKSRYILISRHFPNLSVDQCKDKLFHIWKTNKPKNLKN
eukprot:maker-scaffold_1-snap-gene-19.21-mRNA-1 protein AED:0.06 eAED:0.06 QI:62/0.5/0.33/1/1/1/3/0/296